MLNNYFSMQTVINDQNKHPPQLPLATDSVLDLIRISVQDVNDVLNQRTNGPVNAHLISKPCKAQNIQNLENIW